MFPTSGLAHPELHHLFAGRYLVDGQLPWGGPAPYYRVSSEGTPLVVCVLPMDVARSERAWTEFSQLARRLGQAQAPTLPRLLDAGVIDATPYLAFQETRGTLLSELLRDRTFSSASLLRIATDVLTAVDAAHRSGIVHGDLTPQNIVVSRERDGRMRATVIGTGVVPLLRACPEASAHGTHTGSGEHAVAYMAPELIGSERCPASADLYSVGAMLHHMAVGKLRTLGTEELGFDDIPGLPEVIAIAMERRPRARYQNAATMLAALEWLEVESDKLNPRTQDIAPWMENSRVGAIPVPSIASSLPPLHLSSSHPPGTVLTISQRARPADQGDGVAEPSSPKPENRRWIALLVLLGVLVFGASAWWVQYNGARDGSWWWDNVYQ